MALSVVGVVTLVVGLGLTKVRRVIAVCVWDCAADPNASNSKAETAREGRKMVIFQTIATRLQKSSDGHYRP